MVDTEAVALRIAGVAEITFAIVAVPCNVMTLMPGVIAVVAKIARAS